MKNASPLRYPGGKWRLARFFERLVDINYRTPPTYIEPYAGGASLALTLLFGGHVSEVFLNDLDPAIHAFWKSVVTNAREFSLLVEKTPVTPREWEKQKQIYQAGDEREVFELGFATFFLNRTSHSGILNAGMIGGKEQKGDWKIDARFNRAELVARIRRIGTFKNRIYVSGLDAIAFLKEHRSKQSKTLVYLDPPYYRAGRDLYLNAYCAGDHEGVRDAVAKLRNPWVVSYDDMPQIRHLYRGNKVRHLSLIHTARTPRIGREVMFFSHGVRVPRVF